MSVDSIGIDLNILSKDDKEDKILAEYWQYFAMLTVNQKHIDKKEIPRISSKIEAELKRTREENTSQRSSITSTTSNLSNKISKRLCEENTSQVTHIQTDSIGSETVDSNSQFADIQDRAAAFRSIYPDNLMACSANYSVPAAMAASLNIVK